ncbi:16S rRNA (guanine527-N7)-methyltransferase [Apostasia shenzhenica]|uniref:16S rRNA (Guanine527-N7)-methyltransferase n=1 Tax=Apostasia shenzhenica TaxID=1088818 RepID=A0A2H9ZZX2_9ASPA|nr:16S rRNA (guanine527-N7)-methyltransferase [Apostasia shenzhenica]
MSILASFRHVSAFNSHSGRRLCRRGQGHRRLSTFPRFPPPFSAPLKHVRTLSNSVASSPDSGFLHSPVSTVNAAFDSAVLRTLSSRQKEQISRFVGALLEWNERMNLTAVTEESEVMRRHVEDSLALLPPLRRSYLSNCFSTSDSASSLDYLRLVDVGSGSGLPGLIFAIACPTWKVTLLESMHKRCLFLEHVVGLIGLSNVQVLQERAEIVGQSLDFREQFDVAVARAVAEMRILG